MAAGAFLLLLTITKSADFDIFFHMRVGREIIEGLGLSLRDTISYTAEGARVFTGDWLGKVLLYLVYSIGGWRGLAVLKAVFFLSIMFLVARQMAHLTGGRASASHIALALAAAALAMRFRLSLRPYYFSFIFLSAYLAIFYAWRRGLARRLVYAIPALQLVWANSHSSSVIGPGLMIMFFLTEALRTRKPDANLAGVSIAAVVAGGISPSGFGIYGMLKGFVPFAKGPAEGAGFNISIVDEWMPLDAEMLWGHGFGYTFWFQVLVAGAGLYHVLLFIRKRRVDAFGLALFAGSVYYALRHMRFVDLSSLAIAPMFLGFMDEASDAIRGNKALKAPSARSGWITAGIIGMLAFFSVITGKTYEFGIGPKEGVYPEASIGFLRENGIQGKGFNTVPAGSYMSFAATERKVFIDGRLSYPSDFISRYYLSLKSAENFAELDKEYGFSYALAEYGSRPTWKFPSHLGRNPDWALVQWDRAGAVWVKRLPEHEGLINKFGYRAVRPSFNRFDYLDKSLNKGADLLRDIDWDIGLNPGLQEPHLAKAYAAYYLGLKPVAEKELRLALGMPPDTAFEHTALAVMLFESGDKKAARTEALKALVIDPLNEDARKIAGAY